MLAIAYVSVSPRSPSNAIELAQNALPRFPRNSPHEEDLAKCQIHRRTLIPISKTKSQIAISVSRVLIFSIGKYRDAFGIPHETSNVATYQSSRKPRAIVVCMVLKTSILGRFMDVRICEKTDRDQMKVREVFEKARFLGKQLNRPMWRFVWAILCYPLFLIVLPSTLSIRTLEDIIRDIIATALLFSILIVMFPMISRGNFWQKIFALLLIILPILVLLVAIFGTSLARLF